jgi:hypothetical protein
MIVSGLSLLLAVQAPAQPPRVDGPQPSPAAVAADTGALHHRNGRTPPVVHAVRLKQAIHLDGRLDEGAWATATPANEFTQMNPLEGTASTERTEVRFIYDDDAIYVGARMFDSEPSRVRTQLARRDAYTSADKFEIAFDSYHDHNSTFVFGVNPSGVKTDQLIGQDGFSYDNGWDPVWAVATARDSLGWTAEFRIPFSQLRFSTARTQVWGVNAFRRIERKAEDVRFAWSRPSDRGYASYFGHLFGLQDLPQPRRLEVLPYATMRQERIDPGSPNNPFNDGTREIAAAGLDLKYGITSNLTLDATFNPDFGQVEADPAFVNLTAFEQFFQERRPFFIEGADIFRFGGQQFFYSRRIGRAPQGGPAHSGFVDQPLNATIIGAAKISGRTAGGWSLGLLEAATAPEYAIVDSSGVRYEDVIEPFTNYFVARGKKDFSGGSDQIGFIGTAVNRSINDPRLAFLRDGAYSAGIDFSHRFSKNTYNLSGAFGFSRISGDTGAIRRAQVSSARYYQRPDADHVELNPLLTSLNGWNASLNFGKEAGAYQFGLFGNATSPGFELNDAGFQTSADDIFFSGFVNRRWTRPGKVFRYAFIGNNLNQEQNFGGIRTLLRYNLNWFGQFLNYWGNDLHFSYTWRSLSDGLTRGGPLAFSPASWSFSGGGSTDGRKPIAMFTSVSFSQNEIGGSGLFVYASLDMRPSSTTTISIGPSWSRSNSMLQFVTTRGDALATETYGRQYLFAQVRQRNLDLTTRVNMTFSPTLSLQLYAQPFVATGDYYRFKELERPRSLDYIVYGEAPGSTITCRDGSGATISCDGSSTVPATITVDPDGAGPRATATLGNPDFNVRSLHGNAVLRWEYRPGSTAYFVWSSQCGASPVGPPRMRASDDLQRLCAGPADNVFAVKMNYWLSF